jgi:hypothetical protein
MSNWPASIWIRIWEASVIWPLPIRVENHICLSRDVQVTGAAWWAATRIMAGVRDLMQRTRIGQAQVEYSLLIWSRGWVMLCAVCTVHKETRSVSLLVEPQNQGWRFFSGLASKPLGRVSRFGPQNRQPRFGDLGIKITMTVSWFGPQNQAGYGLSVAPQNQWEDVDGAGHMLGSRG